MIDATRQGYRPVAFRASSLFFCVADLQHVDPMYAWSMAWYVTLFDRAIEDTPKSGVLQERLASLIGCFSLLLYQNVCRSLFEKDKLLFSLTLCVKILQDQRLVDAAEWRFLLTGGISLGGSPRPNPAPDWLLDKSWQFFSTLNVEPTKSPHQIIKGMSPKFSFMIDQA